MKSDLCVTFVSGCGAASAILDHSCGSRVADGVHLAAAAAVGHSLTISSKLNFF